MPAYYNEIDPYAAQWLRNLIAAGHIAPGDVDERSIVDVRPDDLKGYAQCHFFAGVGVWSYTLRRAGWPDDRPVWTGSCPCQPFSAAGKGAGFADERHLWPHFHWLIGQRRPLVVFGEQVASKDGLGWIDLVQADLEGTDYTVGAVDTCSAGIGAPHIRQRLYWVADAVSGGQSGPRGRSGAQEQRTAERGMPNGLVASRLANPMRSGTEHDTGEGLGTEAAADREDRRLPRERLRSGVEGSFCGLADAERLGRERGRPSEAGVAGREEAQPAVAGPREASGARHPGPTNGFWRNADWLFCRDGKWRPVEPGTFPLAHGAPARVGRLRAYGNAINAVQAETFIRAYLDVERLRLNNVSVMTTDNAGVFA